MLPYGPTPQVKILAPEAGYLYLRNHKFFPVRHTIILGDTTITVEAASYLSNIDHVEFYTDNVLRHIDTTPPYQWTWRLHSHLKHHHTLQVIAYDTTGKSVSEEIPVWRFF
jgi:hypothetical protein